MTGTSPAASRRPLRRALPALLPVLLGLFVVGPALTSRGYVLVGDMVFVPDQPWKPAWLGLDGAVPRAVPSDAVTWLAGLLLPGDLVQKALLLGIPVAAGLGVHRLVGETLPEGTPRLLVAAPAVTLYTWNPYVYERLAIGHWALLCGYAALPWAATGARRLRDGDRRGLPTLAVALAVAAWTSPTGGVLAAAVAGAVVATAARGAPRATAVGWWLVLAVGVNLAWAVPGLLSPGGVPESAYGVRAFAARADTPWGTLGSLLSFGGSWKEAVDPPARDSWLLGGVALGLTVLGAWGLWAGRRRDPRLSAGLAVVALGGLIVAWAPATDLGRGLATWLVLHVPGAGLVRDSQKWVAPLALAVAVGLSWLAAGLLERGRRHRTHEAGWVVAAALLPLAVLPGLAWGLLGTFTPVAYPREWHAVRDAMGAVGADRGRTVVLPFDVYRRFDWNRDRAVLDPAPRFFPGQLVTDDSLPVRGGVVPGESRTAARIEAALARSADPARLREVLAEEQVRWVLVHRTAPGAATLPRLPGRLLHAGPTLELLDLGGPAVTRTTRHAALVVAGHALAATALAAGVGAGIVRRSGSSPRRGNSMLGGRR